MRKRKEIELEMLIGIIEGWEEEVIWYWYELLWDFGLVIWLKSEVLILFWIIVYIE